jgi:hypothetical protein
MNRFPNLAVMCQQEVATRQANKLASRNPPRHLLPPLVLTRVVYSLEDQRPQAVCATQRASAIVAVSAGGVSAVCTIDATAPRPPSTAAA